MMLPQPSALSSSNDLQGYSILQENYLPMIRNIINDIMMAIAKLPIIIISNYTQYYPKRQNWTQIESAVMDQSSADKIRPVLSSIQSQWRQIVINDIGLVYDFMGKYEEALKRYRNQRSSRTTMNMQIHQIKLMRFLMGKYEEALKPPGKANKSRENCLACKSQGCGFMLYWEHEANFR